jgi:hypothetical protein
MTLSHRFWKLSAIAIALTVVFTAVTAGAQTVISNETLVTTTLVVSKTDTVAKCTNSGCRVSVPMLSSIPITCPAAIGQTCTLHIALDAKVAIFLHCTSGCGAISLSRDSYQFLVDGAVPTPGPLSPTGDYIFAQYVATTANAPVQQPFPASIVATVTNATSQNHTITVNLTCLDLSYEGCEAETHYSTMRVDVFEP